MQSSEVGLESAAGTESQPEPATVPYVPDIESLNAEHGTALHSLASVILTDRTQAEDAVTQLLAQACNEPPLTADGTSRRVLGRRLYLNCTWTRLVSGLSHGSPSPAPSKPSPTGLTGTIAQLSALPEQQRAIIALFVYGDHTFEEVAELMSLPLPAVLTLARSGLDELFSSDAIAR